MNFEYKDGVRRFSKAPCDIPHRFLFLGQSGQGKTTLVLNLLKKPEFYNGMFHRVYLFAPSAKADWKWKLPKLHPDRVFTKLSVDNIMDKINAEIDENILREKRGLPKNEILVIMDDAGGEKIRHDTYNNDFDRWINILLHFNTSLWLCVQNVASTSITLRHNAERVFIFYTESWPELDIMSRHWGGLDGNIFPKLRRMRKMKGKKGFLMVVKEDGALRYYVDLKGTKLLTAGSAKKRQNGDISRKRKQRESYDSPDDFSEDDDDIFGVESDSDSS